MKSSTLLLSGKGVSFSSSIIGGWEKVETGAAMSNSTGAAY